MAGAVLAGALMLGQAQAQEPALGNSRLDYEFTNNGFEQMFEVSHEVSNAALARFETTVQNYLQYTRVNTGGQYVLGTRNTLAGTLAKTLDFSLAHDISFNASERRFGVYEATLEFNDDQNLFGDAELSLGEDRRVVSGFVANSFDGQGFTIETDAIGEVEWSKTTFADANFFDPDFDFFDYTDEELDAVVWDRTHFVNASLDVDFDPTARGSLRVRPLLHSGVSHNDFSGFAFEAAGAVGLSRAPNQKDGTEADEGAGLGSGLDGDFDFDALSFTEASTLKLDHAGAGFTARDGEVVLAVGRDEAGLVKLAALIFKEFRPLPGTTFSVDVSGSLDQVAGEGLAYGDSQLQLTAQLDPTEDWSLAAEILATHSRNQSIEVSGEFSLDITRLERFQPYIGLEGSYTADNQSLEVPFGFDATLGTTVFLNAELNASYSRFFGGEPDRDLQAKASATLLLPGRALTGDSSPANIELSVIGSRSLIDDAFSVTISGSTVF